MGRPRKEEAPQRRPTVLGTNLRRLIGVHGLTAVEASHLIGISPQAMSELAWRENPSSETLDKLARFFEISMDDLYRSSLTGLLRQIADEERFERVEKKIKRAARPTS
jgi:transcriptional regulator with XRE-family HTH domain